MISDKFCIDLMKKLVSEHGIPYRVTAADILLGALMNYRYGSGY